MAKPKINRELFKKKMGIRLDVGCGKFKQAGYVGLDIARRPGVDIVHDVQVFPWPVPDDCCFQILLSHIWEHIEPKYRFRLMDELWRICRVGGQLMIAAPYAGTYLDYAHPAHYKCPNEFTFTFFDPDYELYRSCSNEEKPKPWKIIRNMPNPVGVIEVIMEKRKCPKKKST